MDDDLISRKFTRAHYPDSVVTVERIIGQCMLVSSPCSIMKDGVMLTWIMYTDLLFDYQPAR